ncbi:MAG: ABC transporter ATP-binding protein [Mycoplasmatales bacterium]
MKTIIQTKNLTKKFDKKIIFEDLNIEIRENEMVAIMGKSGSGKTTFLNTISLIEPPTSGEIFYNDKKISKNKQITKLLREEIGFLFQNFALINEKTVYENLLYAIGKKTRTTKSKMIEILKVVGLPDCIDKKIFFLSGGEQQRVALARLLLKKCNIIFADEPTGSLDELNRDEIIKILKNLQKNGKTIIIVTHDTYVGSACDRTINLSSL